MTYSVPWSSLRIAFLPAYPVPPSQALYALNGSIVGLFADKATYIPKQASAKEEAKAHGDGMNSGNHDNCVKVAPSSSSSSHLVFVSTSAVAVRSGCVGLGIIKSIDTLSQSFIIVTPVPVPLLATINTLVLGQLELPSYLLYKEAPNAPYLTDDAIGGHEMGARAMSGRNFVERYK